MAATLLGMLVTNAFFASMHFSGDRRVFRDDLGSLALKLMQNDFLTSPAGSPSAGGGGNRRGASTAGGAADHTPVPMRSLDSRLPPKYQLRCNCCNRKVTWCCLQCSVPPYGWWPVCPEKTRAKGVTTTHVCLAVHRNDPDITPRARRPRKRQSRKRGRSSPSHNEDEAESASEDESGTESNEECEECEGGEDGGEYE